MLMDKKMFFPIFFVQQNYNYHKLIDNSLMIIYYVYITDIFNYL